MAARAGPEAGGMRSTSVAAVDVPADTISVAGLSGGPCTRCMTRNGGLVCRQSGPAAC
jgi:hypothetical protein